jgi:hypothetical protein
MFHVPNQVLRQIFFSALQIVRVLSEGAEEGE